jgi:hypothetical protein
MKILNGKFNFKLQPYFRLQPSNIKYINGYYIYMSFFDYDNVYFLNNIHKFSLKKDLKGL